MRVGAGQTGKLWRDRHLPAERIYEYEYGALHLPYSAKTGRQRRRAEILHPLFVQRRPRATLRIGQLTDTHVDVRNDVYEENHKQARSQALFNNWNTNFVAAYAHARESADVIFLTGDLIDYGRPLGVDKRNRLADDSLYASIATGSLLQSPRGGRRLQPARVRSSATTIGGSTYPPLPSPGARTLTTDHDTRGSRRSRTSILQAHGDGHERTIAYNDDVGRSFESR
jgi:hypothetical protein